MDIDLSKSDLSETQKYQLLTLLGQYRQAFAKDITELGCTKIGKHIIDTGDANPVRQFPYRTTPKTKEEINTHLDEMEEQGIIRKSMSPWSSPILLVAKPNGEKRVCVDYRKLNRLTKIYTQSLPNLSDVLDTLGEKHAQTYSVCDMRQGFWQLELDEQSKEKTAFMTHRGQYEFNRLPYGLANSPATFNMIMNEVIRDLNWKSALVYVDDILIYNECQRSLETLKTKLTSAPILVFPDFNKEFILHTDASGTAIGYVLGQHDKDKKLRVIAYGGRMLRKPEQRWDVKDRECLALVVAIKQFHVYLANNKFHVFTDHIALQYLHRIKESTGRLARWSMYLQTYNFEVHYQPGKDNVCADFLSRIQHPENQRQRRLSIDEIEATYTATDQSRKETNQQMYKENQRSVVQPVLLQHSGNSKHNSVSAIKAVTEADNSYRNADPLLMIIETTKLTQDRIQAAQNEDEEAGQMLQYIEQNTLPQDKKKADVIVRESNHYVVSNGILFHHYYPRGKGHLSDRVIKQLVVPKSLRNDVLLSYHDAIIAAHPGIDRTYNNIRMKYYWKRMYSDIEDYVKKPPLPATGVFERIHMDILCNLPQSSGGFNQILLVVCPFSKWCEAFPLLGKNFTSNLVKEICKIFQITKLNTSSYHPECNAATERQNRTLATSLRMYCHDNQSTWPDYLQGVMMAFRNTIQTESTQYSPYYLVFGREPRNPIDIALIPESTKGLSKDAESAFKLIVDNLTLARKIAKTNIEAAQQKYKTQHDKNVEEPTFFILDKVWLYCTRTPVGLSPKLQRKWTGPYYIAEHIGEYTYRLRKASDNKILKAPVHANRLKKYLDPKNRPTNPPNEVNEDNDLNPEELMDMPEILDRVNDTIINHTQNQVGKNNQNDQTQLHKDKLPSQNSNPQQDIYDVERILKCRKRGNIKQYLIKWQGYI
ncbi:unnamed protein product [Mytilus edulis]|uniref:Uncharacterized protein n=1 Tax=Mytilus edulis TaxID=6550 RepID=A0A8S3UPR8_MYTED|nr:unnamed protein product [Mytilus edulis]